MFIKQILVIKETREGEKRVALIPEAVSFLVGKNYRILIEQGAGEAAGFSDSDYKKSGAEVISLAVSGIPSDTLILRVKRANEQQEVLESKLYKENTSIIGFLDPLFSEFSETNMQLKRWCDTKVNTFSVGLFKSMAINDPKNMQAAMSRIAGKLAFEDALSRYKGTLPLKLTVIGTGPAAFYAAFEARKIGIEVQTFGRNESYRKIFEQDGIAYNVTPISQNPARFIQPFLKDQPLIITAARKIGEKAPLYIDEQNLTVLSEGTIIVDLAISEGGNVIGSKHDTAIYRNGITIANVSGYPKLVPQEASISYSKCMLSLLEEVLTEKGEILFEHKLLQEAWVTHNGELNKALFERFDISSFPLFSFFR